MGAVMPSAPASDINGIHRSCHGRGSPLHVTARNARRGRDQLRQRARGLHYDACAPRPARSCAKRMKWSVSPRPCSA